MSLINNPNIPIDLQAAYQEIVALHDLGSSKPTRAQLTPSARRINTATATTAERPAMAREGAAWLTTAWWQTHSKGEREAFYVNRYNDILAGTWQAPYWCTLPLFKDTTAIATPRVYDYRPATWPPYADQQHQPTECYYERYNREYNTPIYPSLEPDPSPGWQGTIVEGKFKDLWLATRLLQFSIPTAQQQDTRRPIGIKITISIEATATRRGLAGWFSAVTRASIQKAWWSAVTDGRISKLLQPEWLFKGTIPEDQPAGWDHSEIESIERYGSWRQLENQATNGHVVLIAINTPPSMGRYFMGNDDISISHDESVTVYWPQRPGEL